MDPREFLQLARDLADRDDPSRLRTAISRAYYSAFNVGKEQFTNIGFPLKNSVEAHRELRDMLKNSGNPVLVGVVSKLGDLRNIRNDADYHLENTQVEKVRSAQFWIGVASKAISDLDKAFEGSERYKIIEAMKAYRKKRGGRKKSK